MYRRVAIARAVATSVSSADSVLWEQRRADFAGKGFVLVDRFLDSPALAALRSAVKKGVEERAEHLLKCPRAIDVFKQERDQDPDPVYTSFMKKFKEVSKRKALQRKRKREARRQAKRAAAGNVANPAGAAAPAVVASRTAAPTAPAPPLLVKDASKDDVWEMSRRIAAQLVQTPASVSSVYNDPARLKAINAHRCNVWMTSDVVKSHLFGSVGKAVGTLATNVAGIRRPVLFGDRPLLREGYDKPTMLHCAAPYVGVQSHFRNGDDAEGDPVSCVVWLFLDDTDDMRSPLRYVENSHHVVSKALRRGVRSDGVDVRRLTNLFPPVDSDISYWLQHFPHLISSGTAVEVPRIRAGSALVADAHLMMSLGPNFGKAPHALLQCFVVSEVDAKPSVHPSSWIREWKCTSQSVSFENPVVFPKLY